MLGGVGEYVQGSGMESNTWKTQWQMGNNINTTLKNLRYYEYIEKILNLLHDLDFVAEDRDK